MRVGGLGDVGHSLTAVVPVDAMQIARRGPRIGRFVRHGSPPRFGAASMGAGDRFATNPERRAPPGSCPGAPGHRLRASWRRRYQLFGFEKSTVGAVRAPGVVTSKYSRGLAPVTLAVSDCGRVRMYVL